MLHKVDIDKWITHVLALLVTLTLLALVFYSVVAVDDLEAAKASMGFSAGILGLIMGFYFNRERLSSESKAREEAVGQRDDMDRLRMEMQSGMRREWDDLLSQIEGEPED